MPHTESATGNGWVLRALGLVVVFLASALGGCVGAGSAGDSGAVRRELRGVWVATVANIDWPSKPGLSGDQRRAEMHAILDRAREVNLNAVFFQVRPACDAVYRSSSEPWSEFLSGRQGQEPEDGGDPLEEWTAAAHARGLELHAWFNPFRARHPSERGEPAASHVSVARPEWTRKYGDLLWLDPGVEDARERSLAVILDVVSRYDVDGVHVDDYFYPYPKAGVEFDDQASYHGYVQSGGSLGRDDWRRSNVDSFVREMHGRVKGIKPWVRVSVSPFGIWRPGNPPGVVGFDAVRGLHADARAWLREGWVDAMIPQLYWRIGSVGQPHVALAEWWAGQNPRGRTLAIGLNASRVGAAPGGDDAPAERANWPAHEIINQIVRGRSVPGVGGHVLFSAKPLMENRRGLADALREGVYAEPAMMPELAWSARGDRPRRPTLSVRTQQGRAHISVERADAGADGVCVLRLRTGDVWRTVVLPRGATSLDVPMDPPAGRLSEVRAAAADRFGRMSAWVTARPDPGDGADAPPPRPARP